MEQNMTYVPLHCHSEYSILDGFSQCKDMAKRAKELGLPAIALTDHGTMAGITEFYEACTKEGIKPLLGMEAYTTPMGKSRKERVRYDIKEMRGKPGYVRNNYHLILIAKDYEHGYKNLCALHSAAHAEGTYYKPRIDFELLKEHHEGLVCQSACILGEVANLLWCDDYEKAKQTAQAYQELFGEDYYLEVMNHNLDMELKVMQPIRDLAKELGIKVVVTNDSHFTYKEEHKLQKTMMLWGMKKSWADPDVSGSFFDEDLSSADSSVEDDSGDSDPIFDMPPELYIKSYDEMREANIVNGGENGEVERELANTLEIADKCNCQLPFIDPTDMTQYHVPKYDFENDLQYDEYKKSDFKLRQSTKDAVVKAMQNVGRTGTTLEEVLSEYEYQTLDFLMWMAEKGIDDKVMPKIKAKGEPLPISYWCENPPEGLKVNHAHNSPDEIWLKQLFAEGKNEQDIIQMYYDRLDEEISIIMSKLFAAYFLIVQMYVNYTKLSGSYVGPGRGSGAGSLLNYLIGITSTTDPMSSSLLFFRFISISRASYPDIDCDFAKDFRDGTLKPYLRQRFGEECCASVSTYMYAWGKAAIKGAARVLFNPPDSIEIANELCEVLDDKPKLDLNTELVEGANPAFIATMHKSKKHEQVVNLALKVQGHVIGESIHASAFIMAPEKIVDKLPLTVTKDERERSQKTGEPIREFQAAYGGECLQGSWGYVKLDLLCLKDLEMIDLVQKMTKRVYGCVLHMEKLPLDDADVFQMLLEGYNSGIFQFDGSPVALRILQDSGANSLLDWSAINALNRPGPLQMGYDKDFIEGKKHPEDVTYFSPVAEKYLKETYGTTCIAEGMPILTKKGIKPIEQINVGDYVMSEDGKFNLVSATYDKGIKNCVKIHCDYGGEIICTPEHKILTSNGWCRADELTTNDLIKGCSPTDEPDWNIKPIEDFNWYEWFIGLFIADGHSPKDGGTPSIACCSQDFAEKLAAEAQEHFPSMENINIRCADGRQYGAGVTYHVHFAAAKGKINGSFSANYKVNEVNSLLKEYGLYRQTNENKKWPEKYSFSMLIGMLEGDGCFRNNRLNLKDKVLAYDIFKAMLSYGVHASFYKRDEHSWSVAFNTHRALLAPRLRDCNIRTEENTYIPRKYLERYRYDSHVGHDAKSHYLYGKNGQIPFVRKSTAANCFNWIPNTDEHETWGRVLSVKTAGEHRVFDISVENNHSFACNYLFVQNCYQEQLMQLSQEPSIVGFDGGQADHLRKVTAKKKKDQIEAVKEEAREIAKKNGADPEITEYFLEIAEAAGSYSFNKSHSVAYAVIAYWDAFLKCKFPECFFAAMCTLKPKMKKVDKVPGYLDEARQFGITVKPPHVNYSMESFDVPEKGVIAFGLGGIKNVGNGAGPVIAEREANGPYKDFTDFCTRVPKTVGKSPLEAMIKAGALDGLGWSRKAMEESIDQIIEFRKKYFKEQQQMELFSDDLFGFADEEGPSIELVAPFETEYTERELMAREKEMFGMYFGAEPRDFSKVSRFMAERELMAAEKERIKTGDTEKPLYIPVTDVASMPDKTPVTFIANVGYVKEFTTSKGAKMANITVWDNGFNEESRYGFAPAKATVKLTVFSRTWAAMNRPRPDDVVIVRGRINVDKEGKWPTAVLVDTIEPIAPDAEWTGKNAPMEKLVEYASAKKDFDREVEELSDPGSSRYIVPTIEFKNQTDLTAFELDPDLERYRSVDGRVMVSVAGDTKSLKVLRLRQTMGTVKLALTYGGIAKKARLPKAKSAMDRAALRK